MFKKGVKRRDKDLSVVGEKDRHVFAEVKGKTFESTSRFIKMSLIYYLLRYLFLEAIYYPYDSDVC